MFYIKKTWMGLVVYSFFITIIFPSSSSLHECSSLLKNIERLKLYKEKFLTNHSFHTLKQNIKPSNSNAGSNEVFVVINPYMIPWGEGGIKP